MGAQGIRGRGRLIAPHAIDGIIAQRHQFGAFAAQKLPGFFNPSRRMQARIIADPIPRLQPGGQPVERAAPIQMHPLEQRPIHLIAHLNNIAPIHKHRRLIRQNDGTARRSLEAADPHQPLGIIGDIFTAMFIRKRHHEPGQPAAGQFGTQIGQALSMRMRHERLLWQN